MKHVAHFQGIGEDGKKISGEIAVGEKFKNKIVRLDSLSIHIVPDDGPVLVISPVNRKRAFGSFFEERRTK